MQQELIEGLRLSPQQKHLWSLQRADQSLPYRSQCAVLIEGNLNLVIFKSALERVVNRHEILRTTFNCLPGMDIPFQVIRSSATTFAGPNGSLWSQDHNLSDWQAGQQAAKLEAIFDDLSRQPFDFEQGPLLYVSLVTLSPSKHVLILTLPALCADTATLTNLVREISCAYAACSHSEELTDEPLQYADLAEWQNELLEAEDTAVGREYWHEQDLSTLVHWYLPGENQLTSQSEFQPQVLTLTIDPDLVATIAALARKEATCGISTLLLACWQVLLWRLTGRSDVTIGTVVDGRKYEELEPAIGLFAKYLPLHCHLSENCHFSEILQQVDAASLEIYKWQESFTWEQFIGTNGKVIQSSFFPFCFDFEEAPTKYAAADVSFSIYKHYACIDQFKVKLSCIHKQDALSVKFHYDANLFLAEDIKRLARQFQTLLQSVLTKPEALIGELEILSDRDRQQLLVEFNNTQLDYPKDRCIHNLFEEQAELTPDNIAVAFEDQQLTYAELNARANQLAHYLQKLGVGPDVLVGICVERSLEMIVGILGILKAGGAYVPLDPAYPTERLAFMLADSQVPVLLTQERLVEACPDRKARVFCLDTGWEAIAHESKANPTSRVRIENLAYIIYTSGSTGKPKGVLVTHQNLVHSTYARITYYQTAIARFLLLSSFAFDSSVAGIFWTISQGGMLVLPQEGLQRELPPLLALIAQHQISHLLSLPSLYTLLLEQAKPEQLVSLRTVIVAGEPCPKELIGRHLELLPETSLFNEYGPTEATVWSSVYHCRAQELRAQVPIGRPIANTQIYLLDSHLHPVSVGVPGEVYISGDGLTWGYLNRPELSAEKFIPNPFSDELGSRLYKTGDLARYLPSGNIEFLGRIDHQVKIRGFRIELGEIEAVLGQHPAVREAVVIDREDQPGNKRLVAYVVPNREQAPPAPPALFTDLRGFLKQKLPEYMIPSAFVLLKALPLMPNGKVDRQALPVPDAARSQLDGNFVAPRTLNEQRLAQIWAEVLGRQVGIHDNFFEVGGDSILSMQVIAKSNQAGIQLTPKQLFEYQTIAELAAVAGTAPALYAEQGIVVGQLPLTPIQHWFFEQNRTEPHHFNQALLLEVRQPLDPGLLEQAVQQLLAHHDALRLRFVPEESGWRQVNASPDEMVPFTLIDLSALKEPEQGSALEAKATELQASLNLQEGPLVRVALFNKGAHKSSRLLIVIHHLAVDGVSWRILLEDLQTAYQQLSSGEEVQLPPKTTSFQQWAYGVREYANSAAQEQRDYWLAEFPRQVPRLPVDYPGGDNTVARARTVSVTLSESETQALLLEVPSSYNTQINDVLLTALVQAFGQWTGVPSLLVDLEGHGREDIFDDMDLSRTVGWFTSIFPVLLDLGEARSPGKALKAVKEQLRGIPNRGIGYGLLRYLSDDREMSLQLRSLPQAEVSFNYLGQFDQALSESSLFGLAQESSGLSCSLSGNRSYLLDINGFVAGGQLRLDWTYSEQIHRQSTIERLAQRFGSVLRSLIAHCRSADATESVAALNADAVLDSTIVPENLPVEYATEPAHIFLTGATGFLGAFLLYEFLQQTQADIYCLVRARNAEEGKKRLQSQLEFYSFWNESLSSRIIPVVGDLSQPLLGLSDEQFQELANKLDVIYHNGTAINLVYPYSILKATNVLGTQEILRLACLIKAKPVHYISTLAVLSSLYNSEVKVIRELDSLEHVGVPYGGYAQSKWVAEKLVTTARDRGLPVRIYRLGRISGHSQSGVCNTNDFMHRAIKGCIQLGCAPDVDTTVDMNPVDYVSKAIVHLSRQKESLGKAFHVFNPHPIRASELFNWIRSLGYPLGQVSHDKWQAELLNAHEDSLKNVLYPLLPFFAGSASDSANPAVPQDDCQNTLNGLAGTSIVCPPIDGKLLDTYFSYLIRIGFLDAPRKREMYC